MNTLTKTTTNALLAIAACLAFSSCAQYSDSNPPTPNPAQKSIARAVFVNPYPEGTYEHFQADPLYSKHYKLWKNESLLAATPATLTRIVIDLSNQRGTMFKGDQPIFDYPISSGKTAFPTPPGKYQVLRKLEKDKRSTLYGKIYDAEGTVVNRDADSRTDDIPEGGKFEGAMMAYWMRISWDGIGMHRGRVPRYPASHGCIRTHRSAVKTVFNKVKVGTPVLVVK